MKNIGILGGGQLARMLVLSGYPLGMNFVCIDPKMNCSAEKVVKVHHCDFNNIDAITDHFQDVDCVTYETENLPLPTVLALAKTGKLAPSAEVLNVTQDRLHEKTFFSELNIPTVAYHQVDTWEDLQHAISQMGYPLVIKTRRHGYDGKGQAVIRDIEAAKSAWQGMQQQACIAEKFIPYDVEMSIISVRNKAGDVLFYPLTLNQHHEGILRVSEAPYDNSHLENKAKQYALTVLNKLHYIGVMTIEFFCKNNELLANEIAPRVHNSGHWTIEGADTSQFENHLRAISGLPLGSTKANGFSAMINCISNEPGNMDELLKIPALHFHTYEKEPMPNRKLGHITIHANSKRDLVIQLEKVMASLKS